MFGCNMSSGVIAKSSVALPQLPLLPIQPLQLTACSAASVLPGSPPHRNSSPAMEDDASGSSNFGTENDNQNGQQQPQQSFCLKWNNYQSNVTTTFKELLAEEDFVDITLTADGGALKAHKVVLSACSPYFRDILRGISAWQHPVIVLKDVPYSDLQGIVEFIYHGEVSVFQESLTSFLRTAQILRVKGLTEDTGSEKPPTNNLDNNSGVKFSSNKRSHSHVRKNARPTKSRVASKRQATNSFLGQTSEVLNNNSDEEVVEVAQRPLTVNSSPFNSLPSPSKRPFMLRPTNSTVHVGEGDITDDLEEEEEEAEIDDVEDIEGDDDRTPGNGNGSDDDEEEEELDPPMGSNHGAILNMSAVADALANNPVEAAKILDQHQQLDKRQRQQFLMQGGDILQAGLDPDFLPVGIPQLGKLGNNLICNANSTDGANHKTSNINGSTSAATIAAMANAMVAAAAANANAAAANAGIVAMQQQNQTAAAAAALVSAASSTTTGPGMIGNHPGEPDPNDPNASSQKKTCPYCCQQLSWHALSRHIRDMHRARTGLVTCKYCHKMFRNKNSLGCHMWRFHKDMREKDQSANSNSTSSMKGDSVVEATNQAITSDIDSYPGSEIKSGQSLSTTSFTGGSGSKPSSPASKSEAVIDPPTYVDTSPADMSVPGTKTPDKEKSLTTE